MPFLYRLLLLLLALTNWATAQTPAPASTATAPPALTVRWYGYGFIYLISSSGMRVAIDPFLPNGPLPSNPDMQILDSVDYPFPPQLHADVVLISNQSDNSAGASMLFGDPETFRGTTAIGKNKARGLIFKGVETYLDDQKGQVLGENTCFVFTLDGVRFAHLGQIGHSLDSEQTHGLGSVDVVFVPVGNPNVAVADMQKMAAAVGARIIVPISYATPNTSKLNLRKLDDFLQGAKNVQQIDSNEFTISLKTLPTTPTIFVLKNPTP